uniref:NADH dehydrogenase [ubiquinone] iron-sulfur protein 5 n=1 Tax=Salmo salar TaxID=8030 RepID=B5X831_SALSA|nr:NADH dehydrogenase iron-sulfur protein 5 [Salmo salar]
MPFIDLQGKLGINIDKWMLIQGGDQPYKRAPRCHAFEKEWIECADGIGQTRAKKECKLEFEDFYECMHREKTDNDPKLLQAV